MVLKDTTPVRQAHLAGAFDTFPDAEVNHGEDEQDAESQLPADAAQGLEAL